MVVTGIKKIDAKKSLVYLDEEPAFSLYKSEIRRYQIEEEKELSHENYEQILKVLLRRCRERTAYLLGRSDKSERELRLKLVQGFYPEQIINTVVSEYLMMGYVDDYRYASNYVKYHLSAKSRDRIILSLIAKGIDKEMIHEIMDGYELENEDFRKQQNKIIEKEFVKRKYDFEHENKEMLNKIVTSLCRKGFQYDDVKTVYQQLKENVN
ncbi:MAG: regulatory protein RecX [Lachnospiraceae bacterium]|nr:regulatory protein RecX [Lachnospiraceae bacterium]